MKRLLAWLAGAAGGLAAYRALRRSRTAAADVTQPAVEPDRRAEELRARLEQAKETAVEVPAEPDPEDRRRSVHEEARAAIDEMRGDGAAPESN